MCVCILPYISIHYSFYWRLMMQAVDLTVLVSKQDILNTIQTWIIHCPVNSPIFKSQFDGHSFFSRRQCGVVVRAWASWSNGQWFKFSYSHVVSWKVCLFFCGLHCSYLPWFLLLTDYKSASNLLCQSVLESVVCERFGSKPLRLFRLLLLKKHLEQKQISDMALIPNKEAKEMLYSLLAENFISLQVRQK